MLTDSESGGNTMKPARGVLAAMFAVVFVLALCGIQDATGGPPDPGPTNGRTPSGLRARVSRFALSADTVWRMIREGRQVTLVDIRSREEFAGARIPGSVNIPLYAVKTKPFLGSGLVVLVNRGYQCMSLARECRQLRSRGFNAWYLAGGLNAWKARGLGLEGDPFALGELNRISAAALYRQRGCGAQVIINLSERLTPDAKRILPHARHLALEGGMALDRRKRSVILSLYRCGRPKCPPGYHSATPFTVVVINETGKGYEQVERALRALGITGVFFVRGGIKAYERYVNGLALSRRPRAERLRTTEKCSECENTGVSIAR